MAYFTPSQPKAWTDKALFDGIVAHKTEKFIGGASVQQMMLDQLTAEFVLKAAAKRNAGKLTPAWIAGAMKDLVRYGGLIDAAARRAWYPVPAPPIDCRIIGNLCEIIAREAVGDRAVIPSFDDFLSEQAHDEPEARN